MASTIDNELEKRSNLKRWIVSIYTYGLMTAAFIAAFYVQVKGRTHFPTKALSNCLKPTVIEFPARVLGNVCNRLKLASNIFSLDESVLSCRENKSLM